ncbi:hypothetical protein NR798_17420 [Archangium gephyra]|uniref:hypothetical protein n=1 Tax=Archangium gephyra TaxID=48 RepID=UPI0035D4BC17
MKRTILVCVTAVALSGSAWAQNNQNKEKKPAEHKPAAAAMSEQAPGMDMTKMGPGARKPTNEKQTKKEVTEFFKQQEELGKKGDMEAALAAYDFPVYMVTDDLKGVPESKEYNREEYVAMMTPYYENMPKDLKMTHKPTISVLSDSLVSVIDDFTMTQGKQKVTGRNTSLLVKRDGQWKWKVMVEAGYGGMPAPQGASGGAQTPPEGKK